VCWLPLRYLKTLPNMSASGCRAAGFVGKDVLAEAKDGRRCAISSKSMPLHYGGALHELFADGKLERPF